MTTYQRTIQTRLAFSGRRRQLIENWLIAESVGNRENCEYWAEQMRAANDTEIAVFTVLEDVPF